MRPPLEIRVWLDELLALPDYSWSLPTGVYFGKQWRTYSKTLDRWYIGTYGPLTRDGGSVKIYWHQVVLLQGPRRPVEKSRLDPKGAPYQERGVRETF